MKTIIIGLTGPSGAGKSIVSQIADKFNIAIIDADKLSHEVTQSNSECIKALSNAFGPDILQPSGSIDRKALAKAAFSSNENTAMLNRITHPFIKAKLCQSIKATLKQNPTAIILDAPTLFESGCNEMCDTIISVLAPTEERLKRILARDKISKTAALARIAAGKTDNYYIQRSNYIIVNDSTMEEYFKKITEVIKQILKNGGC